VNSLCGEAARLSSSALSEAGSQPETMHAKSAPEEWTIQQRS